jgi:hypothetical protein
MEVKKNFIQGKMNKDFDVRLIPEGEYIDAKNILISSSEGSNVGSVQNSFGLDKISNITLPIGAKTIGSVSDDGNECIYWFVTSSTGNFIFEYNQLNMGIISTVLEDRRTGDDNVLNFNSQYKITGANIIYNSFNKQKLLVWTDDLNPIRCINIKRAKSYGASTDLVSTFTKQDIGLYKRQPVNAPECTPTTFGDGIENNIKERFLSFGYRYKYLDGEYSATSTFSNPQFYPGNFSLNYQANENEGMINQFNAVNIKFFTGDKNVTDIQLVFKESNSNNIWIIDTFNKKKKNYIDEEYRTFLFSNSKIYSVLPEDEVNRLFDNVPLVAKSQEFIGNRLIYGNYVEGNDMIDSNGVNLNIDYKLYFSSQDIAENVLASGIITEASSSDTISINFSGNSINKGDVFTIYFKATSPSTPINFSGVYICSLSHYIENDYYSAEQFQNSSEFEYFINVIASQNFKLYDLGSNVPDNEVPANRIYNGFQILPSVSSGIIYLKIPHIIYEIDNGVDPVTEVTEYFNITAETDEVILSSGNAFSSCKSNRSYEVGIVYLDDDGRYSTVITNSRNESFNNVFIPVENSVNKNTLRLEINHRPPAFATKYKIFVKDNKLEYQNVFGLLAYKDDSYMWIKLEGQDKNKVKDGDFLLLKKDLYGPSTTLNKVQVLDYSNKDTNFIEGNLIENSTDELKEKSGAYMKVQSTYGLDIDGIENNYFNVKKKKSSNGDNFKLYIGPFSKEVDGNIVFTTVSSGSKIDFDIRNTKFGGDGGKKTFKKSFTAGNEYNTFEDWFNSEMTGNLFPFVEYEWVTGYEGMFNTFVEDPTKFLYLSVRNVLNGNGQHPSYMSGEVTMFGSTGLLIFETDPKDKSSEVYFETQDTYDIVDGYHMGNSNVDADISQDDGVKASINLSFFNCYTQGNGLESYIVKDTFNSNFLSTNTRPNAVELDGYKKIRNIASLTYSGAFDESTKYNSLNEFNLSRANYKDLDDKYGTIQKLFSRDTDLIVFQEDKVHKVLYNKNVLNDAVGGSQITSIESVLGQEVPFSGEWGISKDPDSFSSYANDIYFTDKSKGVVIRLGADGMENISKYGLRDDFKDSFSLYKNKFITAGYDVSENNYVLSFTDESIDMPPLEIECNQLLSKVTIPADTTFSYNMNIGEKPGTFLLNYEISEDGILDIDIDLNGDLISYTNLSGDDKINRAKEYPEGKIIITVINNQSFSIDVSLIADCIDSDQLEVISLVVNDVHDVSYSMINKYTWINSTFGYEGEYLVEDTFLASGLTRFTTVTGSETDGPIPYDDSLIRVSAIRGSGKFTDCNRLGYIITEDVLDAQDLLDFATYPTITVDGDESYVEFTFLRTNTDEKLYLVWDYIDNVSSLYNGDRIIEVAVGGEVLINYLDGVQSQGPVTVTIPFPPVYGTYDIVGNNIVYVHDGDDQHLIDFLHYNLEYDGCEIITECSIDIISGAGLPTCVEYRVSSSAATPQAFTYRDCINNLVSDTVGGAGVYDEVIFCALQDSVSISGVITVNLLGRC